MVTWGKSLNEYKLILLVLYNEERKVTIQIAYLMKFHLNIQVLNFQRLSNKFSAKYLFKSSTLWKKRHGGEREREHGELSYNKRSPIRLTLIS